MPMTGILSPARDRAVGILPINISCFMCGLVRLLAGKVFQQEIFGPLLPILPVRDVQEAYAPCVRT